MSDPTTSPDDGYASEAAQGAGFADAAHFTRTCRRVFGIAPTMLVFEQVPDRDTHG